MPYTFTVPRGRATYYYVPADLYIAMPSDYKLDVRPVRNGIPVHRGIFDTRNKCRGFLPNSHLRVSPLYACVSVIIACVSREGWRQGYI